MTTRNATVKFIGIGAQKCGTTWIHRNLAEHPAVFVATGKDKDTRFFTCYFDRGYQWYEEAFSAAGDCTVVGEVSTSYFYDADAPQRIKAYNPDVKLFVCLRNPVERVISNHRHEARSGHISGNNLSLMAALDNNPAYLLQSRYAQHLRLWYEHFAREQILVLFFDDLRADPARFMSVLYRFLGVDEAFVSPDITAQANVSRIPASRFVEKSILRGGGLLRSAGLGSLVALGRKAGVNDWLRKVNSARNETAVVDISGEALDRIRKELRDDVLSLGEMTGRDLRNWLC